MQPVEKNNLSDEKESMSADTCTSNTVTSTDDVTSPPRLVIPPNRDGALSPTGPARQPPVSPLRQKSNSPGKADWRMSLIYWSQFLEFTRVHVTMRSLYILQCFLQR